MAQGADGGDSRKGSHLRFQRKGDVFKDLFGKFNLAVHIRQPEDRSRSNETDKQNLTLVKVGGDNDLK